MDLNTLQLVVAGGAISLVLSLVRRFFPMSSTVAGYVAIAVCMVVVFVFQYIQANPEWLSYVKEFIALYGAGQLLYQAVLKPTKTDRLIEGK